MLNSARDVRHDVLDLLGQRPLFSLLPLFLHLFLRGA